MRSRGIANAAYANPSTFFSRPITATTAMSSYADKAIDPETGKIRPFKDVMESEIRTKEAARRATILADAEARSKMGETELRLEQAQRLLAEKKHNDAPGQKMWRDHVANLEQTLAAEKAQAAKAKAFAGDRRISLIREEADLIERSGAHLLPRASQVQLDELIAIARSEDWPTPDSQFQAFKQASDRLTDIELEAERVKQNDAAVEAARQEVTLANSRVQQSELELMRARRENVAE